MDLKYIWIEDYKNIKRQGFCFQNQDNELWSFDGSRLSVSVNENAVEAGFFGSNITSVTAIVGKNGSGKSNLMEFIRINLMNYNPDGGGMSYGWIGKLIIVVGRQVQHSEGLILENSEHLQSLGYPVRSFQNAPFLGDFQFKHAVNQGEVSTARLFYYSNYLDARPVEHQPNITDISTDYLISSDLYDAGKFKWKAVPPLHAYYWMEMNRMADFLIVSKGSELPISLPKYLTLYPDFARGNPHLEKPAQKSEVEWFFFDEHEKGLRETLWSSAIDGDTGYQILPGEARKLAFLGLLRLNLLRAFCNLDGRNGGFSTKNVASILAGREFETITDHELRTSIEDTVKIADLVEPEPMEFRSRNLGLGSEELLEEEQEGFMAYLSLEGNNIDVLVDFFSKVRVLLDGNRIWNASIGGHFSSGEKSLLVLLSRLFYTTTAKGLRLEPTEQNLQIYLDEGEVGMHPEWQRNYLKWVLKFLERYFPDRKIQLIVSTHSPFILSDLPAQNVIALDRDELGHSKLVSLEQSQTFGANIHRLFSTGFFMKSTIGALAEDKISGLIDKLNDENLPASEFPILQQLINLIGEPIIQNELQRMLNVKREAAELNDPDLLQRRIEELQQRRTEILNRNDPPATA